ncbi:hypothetical protein C1752_03735 [Acaryochloris thomasi RCC1774]|uniref:Uncharacterized protein n=1 Tax=Acaryochloris thomasi RCC1774 TaxID=1764569 RepID=A0A2W1JFZ1_9CYAN|nr:hypothetical protein [Acaryochloris thomasi]PZD72509.1 hypothetical protein C1752_03735 [Acaryochloris thomasi RCC1774]
MPLKIIENFDGNFTLAPEVKVALFEMLTQDAFLAQVAQNAGCPAVEFTELIFQPLPYSKSTPKGMPSLFEQYHDSEDYVIINVPPNYMFKAKVFKPSRLCAIYRRQS